MWMRVTLSRGLSLNIKQNRMKQTSKTTHPLTHRPTHPCTHPTTNHLFTHPPNHSPTHSPTHLSNQPNKQMKSKANVMWELVLIPLCIQTTYAIHQLPQVPNSMPCPPWWNILPNDELMLCLSNRSLVWFRLNLSLL